MRLPFGLGRSKAAPRPPQARAVPTNEAAADFSVLVIGDSHCHALAQAQEKRKARDQRVAISVRRLAKVKNGIRLGDLDMDEAVRLVARLRPTDMVVSVLGGNQYNTVGLIQPPQPFRVVDGEGQAGPATAELIPERALFELFRSGMSGRDGTRLHELRAAAGCPVYHLVPPPPKQNVDHILRHHETDFAKAGILEHGVTPAALRLRLWSIQREALRQICRLEQVGLLMPPAAAIDPSGFLEPAYYAKDATHANAAYGELVLQMLERLAKDPEAPRAEQIHGRPSL
jgi:hypothetical protein